MKKFFKNENGEVMMESLIVYTITIFLLFFLLALFSVLFQRWNIQTIANETATRVSQTYRLKNADTSTGYMSKDDIIHIERYRYNNDELVDSARKKINDYAVLRLAKTTYTKQIEEPKITVEVKNDKLSRRHIELTIEGSYTVPFGEFLDYFGFNSIIEYKTIAYSECLDMLDYINTVDSIKYISTGSLLNSSTIKMADAFFKLVQDIKNLFN